MSMEHKAFVFDTGKFHTEIEPIIKSSIKNPEVARQYICEHYAQLQSPYTGDTLEEDWEDEFDEPALQVYFDILLTACYDVDDEMGLGEMWDTVNEIVKELDVFEDPEFVVLGKEVVINNVKVDPGMMGLGLIESYEVLDIVHKLVEKREEVGTIGLEDLLFDAESDEWMEAYDDLCNIYEEAIRQGKGLLFTF